MNNALQTAIDRNLIDATATASMVGAKIGIRSIHGWTKEQAFEGDALIKHAVKVTGKKDEAEAVAEYLNNYARAEVAAAYPNPISY